MQVITAINEMIGYVGEAEIDGDDADYASHPLYESALRILESSSRIVQARGWWFNTRNVTLTPSGSAIAIPASYLTVEIAPMYPEDYTVRAGALYDMTNGTAVITDTLEATIRELVDFDDLPESAAHYISLVAAVRFVKTYDGDRSKLQEAKEDRAEAYVVFNTDHIRNSNLNMYQLPNTAFVIANNWHSRYRTR